MDPTSQSAADKLLSRTKPLHRRWANGEECVTGDNHRCNSCTSSRHTEFLGEICMHFPGGLESLDKPLLYAYPKIAVCLDCGFAEFTMRETELKLVREIGSGGVKASS